MMYTNLRDQHADHRPCHAGSARVELGGASRSLPRRRSRSASRCTPTTRGRRTSSATLPGYEVRPILPGEIDAGDYQPRPEDIKKLADLDAIVVNGIGHDDFIFPMIKASGEHEDRRSSARTRRRRRFKSAHGTGVNSHTFISFTNAIQQTYAIQKALAALRPQDAAALQQNAAEYARRLR